MESTNHYTTLDEAKANAKKEVLKTVDMLAPLFSKKHNIDKDVLFDFAAMIEGLASFTCIIENAESVEKINLVLASMEEAYEEEKKEVL